MLPFRSPRQYRSRRRRRQQTRRIPHIPGGVTFYSWLFRIAAVGTVIAILAFFGFTFWISRDLPQPGKLSSSDVADSTKILDRDGDILYAIFEDYNRIYVDLDSIPDHLKQATIATEDKDFYENNGFSFWAYGRVLKDVVLKQRVTGGSGITQQLVKNVLLSPERTVTRKVKELILAVQVDKRYSKDEILELYLNNVSYGGTAVGVETASNLYFEKSVEDLTLPESAFLAGLPQSPSYYSPIIGGGDAYIGRTESVLRRMVEDEYIEQEEADKALAEVKKFTFTNRASNIRAPHFVMYVRQLLVDSFGEQVVNSGNLEVQTTLDWEVQKEAERIVNEEIEALDGYNVGNGAAVVLDGKTGAILSMVGSSDYFDEENDGNFNASTALRQPGSSLKPIMYAAALDRGFTASTLIMDVSTEFPNNDNQESVYTPVNYDGEYRGPVQLRFALGNSLNVPAVKMLARVGVEPVMSLAYDMGIENWEPTSSNISNVGLSLVLGGREASLLQITSSYQVFANGGEKQDPYSIVKVTDKDGKVLYEHEEEEGERVLPEEVAYIISHILLDNNARQPTFGPNSWLVVPGRTVAAKTGTTDEKRDNWTVGYTPSYVVGVWVGNNDNSPMNPAIASGVTGAAPIWHKIMAEVLSDKENEEFVQPEDVIALQVDAFSGGLPRDGQEVRSEFFVKGTEPTTISPIYSQLKMSQKDSSRLANSCEIERGDYDVRDFVAFQEDDPVSRDERNRWQEAIDVWVDNTYGNDPLYQLPDETSDHDCGDVESAQDSNNNDEEENDDEDD